MLRKIGSNYQVAVPREVVKALQLRVNDYIDIRLENRKIVLEPQVFIPKDQAYFYAPEWQKEEKAAQGDLEKRRVTKTKNLKDLFRALDG